MESRFLSAITTVLLTWVPVAHAGDVRDFVTSAIVNPSAYYPEGPQIVDDGLLVAEMPKDRIVLLKAGEVKPVWSAPGCGPTSIKKIPAGGYWVLCHLGHYVAKLDDNFRVLRTFQQTAAGRRISWPNDASVDSRGNLYLSSSGVFSHQAPAEGRVIFIDIVKDIASDVVGGLRYANGVLVQEGRRRVLVSEHLGRRMLAYPLLGAGQFGQPSVFFDFKDSPQVKDSYEQSGPDGIAAFSNGDICVADYGNGRVLVLSAKGKFLTQIPLRYRFVTNMAITNDQHSIFIVMTQSNMSSDLHGVVERFSILTRRKS